MLSKDKKTYFTAGPAKIPAEVMLRVRDELLDYNGLNISVMEMSHRSPEFGSIIKEAEANLRKLIKVPDNYTILFMHGGAKSQFDSVPMNLCTEPGKHKVEYIVNGSWSKMAAEEAKKYAEVVVQQLETFNRQPARGELVEPHGMTYRYYCDNETIQGVEFTHVPSYSNGFDVPLVCDMTSNFLSRPIDVSKFGIIFAGAQKNCGIAGLTIVIIRNDLIGKHMSFTPKIQNYQVMQKDNSLSNTPLTFAIYVANLCAKWALDRGGLEAMDEFSKEKSQLLYDLIDQSNGFYTSPVDKSSRSRMNIVFLLGDKSLEAKFLEESRAANLFELKGHRSVGGFRASVYNGVTIDDVKRLACFMHEFMSKYQGRC